MRNVAFRRWHTLSRKPHSPSYVTLPNLLPPSQPCLSSSLQVMALTSEAEKLAAKKASPDQAMAVLEEAKAEPEATVASVMAEGAEGMPPAVQEAAPAVKMVKGMPEAAPAVKMVKGMPEAAPEEGEGEEDQAGDQEEQEEEPMHEEMSLVSTREMVGGEVEGEEEEGEEEEGEEEEGEEEEEILESDPEIDPYERASSEASKYASMNLKVIHERGRTGFEEHKDFPIRLHSLIAARYQVKEYLGSAAFSKAVQCLDLHTGEMVCVKIIKNNKDFFDQSLDEVMLLDYLKQHDPDDSHYVVHIFDYFYHREHLFIVCEVSARHAARADFSLGRSVIYLFLLPPIPPHHAHSSSSEYTRLPLSQLLRDNLYEFSRYNRDSGGEPYFTLPRLRRIARQCCEALSFVHGLNLIHCDLKPENILIRSYSRCEIKVIDFGSSCYTTDHLSSYVQSRSYRAPEVILGMAYDGKIDMWSLGAILAELLTGYVLFQNDSVAAMLARIASIVGPFPQQLLAKGRHAHKYFVDGMVYERDRDGLPFILRPKRTSLRARCHTDDQLFLSFVGSLLSLDPDERPTAQQALQHPWLATDPYGGWPPADTADAMQQPSALPPVTV